MSKPGAAIPTVDDVQSSVSASEEPSSQSGSSSNGHQPIRGQVDDVMCRAKTSVCSSTSSGHGGRHSKTGMEKCPDIEASMQDGSHEPLKEKITAPLCKEESGLEERSSDRWADILDSPDEDQQPSTSRKLQASIPNQSQGAVGGQLPAIFSQGADGGTESVFLPGSRDHEERAGFENLQQLLSIQRLNSDEVLYADVKKPPKILNDYLFGDLLGEGSYGKVKEVLNCGDLTRRAVKIMKERRLRRIPNGLQNVHTEIRLLRRLCHPNVVGLLDFWRRDEKQKLYMVMEYCCGSLQEMLEQAPGKRFPIWQAHHYFLQLVQGIEYLHGSGVVHKDIKPGNLLLSPDDTLKISDFGVAEEIGLYTGDDLISMGQGTPKFQAPEIAGGNFERFRAFPLDWWSAGITLFNLVTGDYPFTGSTILKLYESIVHDDITYPKEPELDDNLKRLLQGMLTKVPDSRIDASGIRKQAWYKKKPHFSRLDRVFLPPLRSGALNRPMSVMPQLCQLYDASSTPEFGSSGGFSDTNGPIDFRASGHFEAVGPSNSNSCLGGKNGGHPNSNAVSGTPNRSGAGGERRDRLHREVSRNSSKRAYGSVDSIDTEEKREEPAHLPYAEAAAQHLAAGPPIRKATSEGGFSSRFRKKMGNCKMQ